MRQITLPLLRPTIALMLVLLVTNSLLTFDQFFILTGGRHGTATVVIDIYREAFTSQDLGRAAAISVAHPGRAPRHQRHPAAPAAASRPALRSAVFRSFVARVRDASFYSTSSALAVLFLTPMLWTLYTLASTAAARPRRTGSWGVENYRRAALLRQRPAAST